MGSVRTLQLSLFVFFTCLLSHLCNSQRKQLTNNNIDPKDLSYFISSNTKTWQKFLTEATFPTRDHCMSVMCAPRQQTQFPFQWNGYGSAALDIWGPPGLVEPGLASVKSPIDPKYVLEDIRRGLGEDAAFIYDDEGRVIGILPSDNGQGLESQRPSSNLEGSLEELEGNNNRPEPSNVDVCCQTREAFFINATLTDIYGITRTIAQYSVVGSYQFIRHGICGSSGSCRGQCVPQYITIPLAIYPTASNQLVTFSFFHIPGYCTCRVLFSEGR